MDDYPRFSSEFQKKEETEKEFFGTQKNNVSIWQRFFVPKSYLLTLLFMLNLAVDFLDLIILLHMLFLAMRILVS